MRLLNTVVRALTLLGLKAKQVSVPPLEQSQPQRKLRSGLDLDAQQGRDAQTVADQLLGRMLPLWLSRQSLDLNVRHQMGTILKEGLYPPDQKRLPYGGQVMKHVSKALEMSQPNLHQMVKFSREFLTLADFKAKHPSVTTWDGVKKVLATTSKAKATSSKSHPTDPALAIWTKFDKQRDAIMDTLASVPQGSKQEYAQERQSRVQAIVEEFQKLLSNNSTVTQNSSVTVPSTEEVTTQLES
jgi:hypothetical protein